MKSEAYENKLKKSQDLDSYKKKGQLTKVYKDARLKIRARAY